MNEWFKCAERYSLRAVNSRNPRLYQVGLPGRGAWRSGAQGASAEAGQGIPPTQRSRSFRAEKSSSISEPSRTGRSHARFTFRIAHGRLAGSSTNPISHSDKLYRNEILAFINSLVFASGSRITITILVGNVATITFGNK